MGRWRASVAVLLLMGSTACVEPFRPDTVLYAPMHGQTGVARTAELRMIVGDVGAPPDHPLPPDLIRVVDLDGGGFVPGEVRLEGDELRFRPALPWQPDRRYLWRIDEVPPLARAPELHFPASMVGEAVFSTVAETEVLEMTLKDGRVCALLSQSDDGSARVAVTVDGGPPVEVGYELTEESEHITLPLDGVDVACLTGLDPVEVGASIRIWWDDRGPWHAILGERPIGRLILIRRRAR